MNIRASILGFIAWVFFRCLSSTWKITLVEPLTLQTRLKNKETTLFAHWHGDELVLLYLIKSYRIATLVSTSKDGQIMNSLLGWIGGTTTRGSSTRGGAEGLRKLIKIVRSQKKNSSFAVDGPKGPIYKVKPGIFEMARFLDSPIYPCGVSCDRAWRFNKSWNKTYLPKPFAKICIFWGEELRYDLKSLDPRSEELAKGLETALRYSKDMSQKTLSVKKTEC